MTFSAFLLSNIITIFLNDIHFQFFHIVSKSFHASFLCIVITIKNTKHIPEDTNQIRINLILFSNSSCFTVPKPPLRKADAVSTNTIEPTCKQDVQFLCL